MSFTRSRVSRHRFLSLALGALVVLTLALPGSTASAATPVPFLTLPFEPNPGMNILSGWYYSSSGGFHGGIDYISGDVNSTKSWKSFPVIASADGEACGNCTSRQGNAVWIKHNVNGATYYTYYGHLALIEASIPIGSQSRTIPVKRGDLLGMAGDTGAGSGITHLHFALYNSGSAPQEPYGIGKLREAYPAPHSGQPGMGWFLADAPAAPPAPPEAPAAPPEAKEPLSSFYATNDGHLRLIHSSASGHRAQ